MGYTKKEAIKQTALAVKEDRVQTEEITLHVCKDTADFFARLTPHGRKKGISLLCISQK